MHGLGVLVFPKKYSFLLQGINKSMATKDGREKHVQHQHMFTNGTPPKNNNKSKHRRKHMKNTLCVCVCVCVRARVPRAQNYCFRDAGDNFETAPGAACY